MRFPGTRAVSGYSIPMITELINDTNVQFLDQDDDDGKSHHADPLPLKTKIICTRKWFLTFKYFRS